MQVTATKYTSDCVHLKNSLQKDGMAVNSTLQLTKAMKATLDWSDGIYGTIVLTEGKNIFCWYNCVDRG